LLLFTNQFVEERIIVCVACAIDLVRLPRRRIGFAVGRGQIEFDAFGVDGGDEEHCEQDAEKGDLERDRGEPASRLHLV
jgi:hypothetical protein